MRTLLALAFAALVTPALAASSLEMANGYGWIGAQRDIDPLHLGLLFCQARMKGDMTPIEKYYAPKLVELLHEVPPGTAVPWQALPNHPNTCGVQIINGFDNTVGVMVEVMYSSGIRQWNDTLNLERTPTSWWINNVFYAGGGNLRFRLAALTP